MDPLEATRNFLGMAFWGLLFGFPVCWILRTANRWKLVRRWIGKWVAIGPVVALLGGSLAFLMSGWVGFVGGGISTLFVAGWFLLISTIREAVKEPTIGNE